MPPTILSLAKTKPPVKSPGTVVIGVGRMGQRHLQNLRRLNSPLVGVCDQSLEALEGTAREFGIASDQQFKEAEALFKVTKPTCVIISTTAPSHCGYTCMAARAGAKYILCEKPMAISLEECDRMIATCKRYGTKLAVNHQMRFMEQYIEPKRMVESKEFGGFSSVTVVGGNFGMAMNGTHYFEMFRYLTDEEPYEVTAWFSNDKVPNPRGRQFEDRAGSVRVITKSGKRLYIEIGADQGHGVKVIYSGGRGQIVVDELNGTMQIDIRQKQHRKLPTTRYAMPGVHTVKKIRPVDILEPSKAVLKALLEGKNYPTGEEGRLAVATLVAAYVSNENGHKPTRVDGHLPAERIFPWA